MHVRGRQEVVDPQDPASGICTVVGGLIRHFRLIEFQVHEGSIFRALDLPVLKTLLHADKVFVFIVKIDLVHSAEDKGEALITGKIADLELILKLGEVDHVDGAGLFRGNDLVPLRIERALLQMFFGVDAHENTGKQFRTVACSH